MERNYVEFHSFLSKLVTRFPLPNIAGQSSLVVNPHIPLRLSFIITVLLNGCPLLGRCLKHCSNIMARDTFIYIDF